MFDNGNGDDEGGFSTQPEPIFREGERGEPTPTPEPPAPAPEPSEKKGE